jgi:hypothetical protein
VLRRVFVPKREEDSISRRILDARYYYNDHITEGEMDRARSTHCTDKEIHKFVDEKT